MKIAVNTRLLLKNRLEGIGRFIYESFKRIVVDHPEVEFYFLFDRPYDNEFIFGNNVTPIVISPPARHPFLFIYWYEISVKRALKKIKPDLFISPDNMTSLSINCKTLLVIHDLNIEYHPEGLKFCNLKYYKYFLPKFANKANRIATVSEYSKNDIQKLYKIDPSKIDVVYSGTNDSFLPLNEKEKKNVKAKYAHGNNYFVYVGSLHFRKNLVNLFKAFDLFKRTDKNNFFLVIVGAKMGRANEIDRAYKNMEYKDNVVFTGRVETSEINSLIASSVALTYVSLFEGFGLPIVEAFKSATPVITSNVTSMPEVAGDAALLVAPFNIDDIANAMKKIATDENLRNVLIQKGLNRVNQFSWDNTANKLWSAIMRTINS